MATMSGPNARDWVTWAVSRRAVVIVTATATAARQATMANVIGTVDPSLASASHPGKGWADQAAQPEGQEHQAHHAAEPDAPEVTHRDLRSEGDEAPVSDTQHRANTTSHGYEPPASSHRERPPVAPQGTLERAEWRGHALTRW